MKCHIPPIDILLLGKSSRIRHKQDNTHKDLVEKLNNSSLSTNYINWDENTLDYISNPSLAKNYRLIIYDTVSNIFSFDDEGPKRTKFFEEKVVNSLISMQKPIIILSDHYIGDRIKKINENNGFTHINQPYNVDHVYQTIKKILK